MTQQQWWDKINGVGITFRFITPTLIMIIGYLLNLGIVDIKLKISDLDKHFTNHLMHHQELEVGYERRMTATETQLKILIESESSNNLAQNIRISEAKQRIDNIEHKIYK